MPDSVDNIIQNMLTQLRAEDPAFSAEVGTPERNIIEATAELIAQAQVDYSVLASSLDINSLSAGSLDSFAAMLGFARQQSTCATGVVTFSRNSAATADIVIPTGTQVQATASDPSMPDIVFSLTQTVTLANGTTSVDAALQATLPGTIGNVPANAISAFGGLKQIVGITTVNNSAPTTGGADGEDDTLFRTRIQNSLFRNMAGTFDQFMALALTGQDTTKVIVIGPVSRYQEYIQIPYVDDTNQQASNYDPSGSSYPHKRTTQPSTIPYSKYTYNVNYNVTDGTIGTASTYYKPNVDYFFNQIAVDPTSSPRNVWTSASPNQATPGGTLSPKALHQPNVTILNPYDANLNASGNQALAAGNIVFFEHQYMSKNSRNDVPSGVLNAVDVFVNGAQPTTVKAQESMPPTGNSLQQSNTATWTYQNTTASPPVINFVNALNGAAIANTARILPTFWQPTLSLPDQIQVKNNSDGKTYVFYNAKYYDPVGNEYYFDAAHTLVASYLPAIEVNGMYGTNRARNGFAFRQKNVYKSDGVTQATVTAQDSGFIGQQFSATYTYDANVAQLQAVMEQNKQITTDVLVHAAYQRYFKLYLTIMYTPGSTPSVVNLAINTAVAAFFENLYFGAVVQLSDLLQAVHNVAGVDNVRWTSDILPSGSKAWQASHTYSVGDFVRPTVDNGHIFQVIVGGASGTTEPTWPTSPMSVVTQGAVTYQEVAARHRVEEVNVDGSSLSLPTRDGRTAPYYDYDFYLLDNQLPSAPNSNQTEIRVRSQATWTAVL